MGMGNFHLEVIFYNTPTFLILILIVIVILLLAGIPLQAVAATGIQRLYQAPAREYAISRGPDTTHRPHRRRCSGVGAYRAHRDGTTTQVEWRDHAHRDSPIHPIHLCKTVVGKDTNIKRSITRQQPHPVGGERNRGRRPLGHACVDASTTVRTVAVLPCALTAPLHASYLGT